MSDNDLIRRGDVLAVIGPMQWSNSPIAAMAACDAYKSIDAIPAADPLADPRVRALVEAANAGLIGLEWAGHHLEQHGTISVTVNVAYRGLSAALIAIQETKP
jgi:hypothetical protein